MGTGSGVPREAKLGHPCLSPLFYNLGTGHPRIARVLLSLYLLRAYLNACAGNGGNAPADLDRFLPGKQAQQT